MTFIIKKCCKISSYLSFINHSESLAPWLALSRILMKIILKEKSCLEKFTLHHEFKVIWAVISLLIKFGKVLWISIEKCLGLQCTQTL